MNVQNTLFKQQSIGIVKTDYADFDELLLESGEMIAPFKIAYEMYGKLNPSKSNAVLVCHALSGDAHAAGFHESQNKPGWWDSMIGQGRAFDTDRYFVICSNVLGGCSGSTGPSSTNPATGLAYGIDFPVITIGDMVSAQKKLTEYLGIEKLLAVAGGSMGGMQALEWLIKYPDNTGGAVLISTSSKHSPQQIAFNEVGRQAIMADPSWQNGSYYGSDYPGRGLAVARMIGHITFMSDASMMKKFGRQKKLEKEPFKFNPDFEVEGYLQYRGNSFVKRFDANSYLYITKAMDYYDASRGKQLFEVLMGIQSQALVIAFKSDWLYPEYQSQEIIKACKLAGVASSYCVIESNYGHDAFLLETVEQSHLIRHFLKRVGSSC